MITGTPTTVAISSFTLQATDSASNTATQAFAVTINANKFVTDGTRTIALHASDESGTTSTDTLLTIIVDNTPALIGASASGFALGKSATPADGQLVQRLFSSVGMAYQLKESLLDAVTGLSGMSEAPKSTVLALICAIPPPEPIDW